MNRYDVYIYGMTVLSTIHLLRDKFPVPNSYQEIKHTYIIPGGEGGNAAIVLRNLGVSVALDGCCLGDKTADAITQYMTARDVDCSRMTRLAEFEGWQDIVFCDGNSRTVFGWFVQHLFGNRRLWTIPDEDAIRQAQCVALDPFFGAESALVANWCEKHGKDYVTIDCGWDNPIAKRGRAVVCSQEFLEREYPGADYTQLITRYHSACAGLVIFTFGGTDIVYMSPVHTAPAHFTPFRVPVMDTLGAGDTFRAGIVYGILNHLSDEEMVRFAAACAAIVCTRFPSVAQPPTLDEIDALITKARNH